MYHVWNIPLSIAIKPCIHRSTHVRIKRHPSKQKLHFKTNYDERQLIDVVVASWRVLFSNVQSADAKKSSSSSKAAAVIFIPLFTVQCSVFNQCAFYRTRKNWRRRRRGRRGKIEIAHVQHNIKRPCGHILLHASSNRNTGAPQLQLEWMNGWIEMFVGRKEEKKLEQKMKHRILS